MPLIWFFIMVMIQVACLLIGVACILALRELKADPEAGPSRVFFKGKSGEQGEATPFVDILEDCYHGVEDRDSRTETVGGM